MGRPGFIHDKLDIKVLILYVMSRVAASIDFAALTELSLCDDGIDYFDYAECVDDLVTSEHLTEDDKHLYAITEKGERNGSICESSLPYTVRKKCDKALAKLNAILRRNAQVRVEIEPRDEDCYTLRLILDDETDNIMTLELLTVSEQQAQKLGEQFRARPELTYNGILRLLTQATEKKTDMSPPAEDPQG